MRWLLSTPSGSTIGSARTTSERDSLAITYIGREPSTTRTVVATDTRTGRVIELSRPLRKRTLVQAAGTVASEP